MSAHLDTIIFAALAALAVLATPWLGVMCWYRSILRDMERSEEASLEDDDMKDSETPETDAVLVKHTPENPSEWSEHYLALSIHARKLERERDTARIPICIGRPIIEILAKDGMWTSENGNSVVAADCLFGRNPYQEIPTISHK